MVAVGLQPAIVVGACRKARLACVTADKRRQMRLRLLLAYGCEA